MLLTEQERKVKRLLASTTGIIAAIAPDSIRYFNDTFFKEQTKSAVRHRETCPECGRKLVNLYWRKSGYKCRACWERFEKDNALKEMGIAVFNADGSRKSDDEILEAIKDVGEKE